MAVGDVTRRRIMHRGGGLQVTRRRRSLLIDTGAGIPANATSRGSVITPLKVRNSAVIGATAIDLYAANLVGSIQQGSTVTIAAHTYQVTATVRATGGVLSAVPLTPALIANVAAEAIATTPATYSDLLFYAMSSKSEEEEIDGLATADRNLYRVLPNGSETWLKGDLLIDDGKIRRVEHVLSSGPAGAVIRWDVLVGEAA